MLSKKMLAALNDQINAETYSAYLYWSMASYFEPMNLDGFANWMKVQAQEEMVHAMKFYIFINDRGGKADLGAIAAPPTTWKSPLDVFEATCKHEALVTARINKLVDLAIKESDHATNSMLKWFVDEQVEEESSADAIRQKLRLIGKSGEALLLLDKELAARVFVNPLTAGAEAGA